MKEQTIERVKHTPGPWKVHKQHHRMRVVMQKGEPGQPGYAFRHITSDWHESKSGAKRGETPSYHGWYEIDEANARLIAAAPELLETLRECITEYGALAFRNAEFAHNRLNAISDAARAAIAKATGKDV